MEATDISSNNQLDHALVQCLRLFAKHGRKIRNHELIPENHVTDEEAIIGILKNNHGNTTANSEAPLFRQVVE